MWRESEKMIYDTNFSRDYIEQLESILGSEWVNSATNIEDKVLDEIKKLRSEKERLREALTEIECRAYGTIYDIAVQALKEVTNHNSDYKEHLLNIPENEHRRLHKGRWNNDENEMETCPACGGSTYTDCMAANGGMTQIPCANCGGSGEVTK